MSLPDDSPGEKSILRLGNVANYLTFENSLITLIVLGAAFRIITIWTGLVYVDGAFYSALGDSVSKGQGFIIPWYDIQTYSYSLTYPVYLAGFYAAFGYGFAVTIVASVISGLIVLPITYLTTKDLYDRRRGLIATALISVNVTLITLTGRNHIENMVLIFSILTFWSILKTKDDSRFYVPFGLFAGLTYFTKTDVGTALAIFAAVAVMIWAFWHEKMKALKNFYLYVGVLVLIAFGILRWILTSSISGASISASASYSESILSGRGVTAFFSQIPLHLILIGSFAAFFTPELISSLKQFRERQRSMLWLGILGLLLAILVHASTYSVFSYHPVVAVSSKYITIIFVPILWLVFSENEFDGNLPRVNMAGLKYLIASLRERWRWVLIFLVSVPVAIFAFLNLDEWMALTFFLGALSLVLVSGKTRLLIMLVAFLVLSANAMTAVAHPPFLDIAERMNDDLEPGDTISIHRIEGVSPGFATLNLYPYLGTRDVSFENYTDGINVTYIISQFQINYTGYTLIGTFHDKSESTVLKKAFSGIISSLTGRELASGGEPTTYLWLNDYR